MSVFDASKIFYNGSLENCLFYKFSDVAADLEGAKSFMPFPFTLKEHPPVLLCLSSVYWANRNTSHDWANMAMGKGPKPLLFKHQISLTIFHKKFGPVKVSALKMQTAKYT